MWQAVAAENHRCYKGLCLPCWVMLAMACGAVLKSGCPVWETRETEHVGDQLHQLNNTVYIELTESQLPPWCSVSSARTAVVSEAGVRVVPAHPWGCLICGRCCRWCSCAWRTRQLCLFRLCLDGGWAERERASQGKGKRNVAGRGWVERYTEEWGKTRGNTVVCCTNHLSPNSGEGLKWSDLLCGGTHKWATAPQTHQRSFLLWKKGAAPRWHTHWPHWHQDLGKHRLVGQRSHCHG